MSATLDFPVLPSTAQPAATIPPAKSGWQGYVETEEEYSRGESTFIVKLIFRVAAPELVQGNPFQELVAGPVGVEVAKMVAEMPEMKFILDLDEKVRDAEKTLKTAELQQKQFGLDKEKIHNDFSGSVAEIGQRLREIQAKEKELAAQVTLAKEGLAHVQSKIAQTRQVVESAKKDLTDRLTRERVEAIRLELVEASKLDVDGPKLYRLLTAVQQANRKVAVAATQVL